jgi:hypothetical protein
MVTNTMPGSTPIDRVHPNADFRDSSSCCAEVRDVVDE